MAITSLQEKNVIVPITESIKEFESKIQKALNINDKIRAMVELASCVSRSNPKRAIEILHQGILIGEENELPNRVGQCHLVLAGFHRGIGEVEVAFKHGNKALELARNLGNALAIASALNNLATIHFDLGNSETALKYFKESLAIKRSSVKRDILAEALSLVNIGEVLKDHFEYHTSLKYFLEALTLSREAGDNHIETLALLGIGEIYNHLGIIGEAKQNYHAALNLSRQRVDLKDICDCLVSLGKFTEKNDQVEESAAYLSEAFTIAEKLHSKLKMAQILNVQARIALKNDDPRLAKQYFEDASDFARASGYKEELLKAEYGIAELVFTESDIKNTAVMENIMQRSLEIGLKDIALRGHQFLSDSLKRAGAFEKAFDHLKEFTRLRESIIKEESDKALTILRTEYEFEEVQREAEVFKLSALQLEHKLHYQHEELQLRTTQLVTQTELLAKFRDELREIMRQSASQDPTIRAIKEKLKELPCKQIDWEKFETEFKAVHPEFSRKLNEKFSSLTPTETKMCSLLRLNLKSHEIARLFCLSERSVETHRFNIRKKLGLDREKSLSMFLNSL